VPGLLRITIMVAVTLLVETLLLGGTSKRQFAPTASLVTFFWTIPVIVIISILHGIDRVSGLTGTWGIALIGVAPAAFFMVGAPAMGVKGGLNAYAVTGCLAGLFWSVAWIMTA